MTSNYSFSTAADGPRESPYLSPVLPSEESHRVSFVDQGQNSRRLAAPSRRNDIMRIATLPKQPPLDVGRWTDVDQNA